jgi:hypothetical protein
MGHQPSPRHAGPGGRPCARAGGKKAMSSRGQRELSTVLPRVVRRRRLRVRSARWSAAPTSIKPRRVRPRLARGFNVGAFGGVCASCPQPHAPRGFAWLGYLTCRKEKSSNFDKSVQDIGKHGHLRLDLAGNFQGIRSKQVASNGLRPM